MAWPPTQTDERRAFEEDGKWFENDYSCPNCDTKWTDQWSCTCDDDCPTCGTTCSPFESNKIDFDSDDVCPGCGVPMGTDHKEDCEEAEPMDTTT